MTTIDSARRRSTDEILNHAMEEAGNGDPKKVAEGGRPLHYDSLTGLGTHRAGTKPTDEEGLKVLGEAGAGKVGGAAVDALVDKAVGSMATMAARSALGAAWQVTSTATLAYQAPIRAQRQLRKLVDAAHLARGAAHDIAACMRGAASAMDHAKSARARGDGVAAANFEERASAAVAHAAELEKMALAPVLDRAHADAAYGLGVQSAMHHALRVELGKERPEDFAAGVAKARADLATVETSTVRVQG